MTQTQVLEKFRDFSSDNGSEYDEMSSESEVENELDNLVNQASLIPLPNIQRENIISEGFTESQRKIILVGINISLLVIFFRRIIDL